MPAPAEEEWYPEEVEALRRGVVEQDLVLMVFAEWYNTASMMQVGGLIHMPAATTLGGIRAWCWRCSPRGTTRRG